MLTILTDHAVTVSFPMPSGALVDCVVTNTGTSAVRLAAVEVFEHDDDTTATRHSCSMGLVGSAPSVFLRRRP